MGLRLVPATHDAEGDAHIALLHHGRDDGVEWPLAGLQCIRGCRIEGEECAAILQGKTRSRRDQSRPEILKVALDERSEEHTSELQSRLHLVCRLLLEKKKKI